MQSDISKFFSGGRGQKRAAPAGAPADADADTVRGCVARAAACPWVRFVCRRDRPVDACALCAPQATTDKRARGAASGNAAAAELALQAASAVMNVDVRDSWKPLLHREAAKPYFAGLIKFLEAEQRRYVGFRAPRCAARLTPAAAGSRSTRRGTACSRRCGCASCRTCAS